MSLAPLRLCCQWPACLLHNRPLAQVSFDFIWKSRLSRIYVVSQNQTVCYFCSLVLFALPSPLFVSTFAHTAGGNSHVLRDNPFTCLYYYQFYTVTRKCPFFNFCSIWSQKLFLFHVVVSLCSIICQSAHSRSHHFPCTAYNWQYAAETKAVFKLLRRCCPMCTFWEKCVSRQRLKTTPALIMILISRMMRRFCSGFI